MLESNFILDEINSLLISQINYNQESDSIELLSSDFKTLDVKVKVKTRINNLYLIKDKLLKCDLVKINDTSFIFNDNKYLTFVMVVNLFNLNQHLNKPSIGEMTINIVKAMKKINV